MMHTNRLETTLASVLTIATLLVGCASAPTEQIGQTQAAIADAERAKAPEYAPVDLHEANRKLEQAQANMERKDYRSARWLAEQAEVDAELANMKARSTEAEAAAAALQQNIQMLRAELANMSN